MTDKDDPCPRCGGIEFTEHEQDALSWEDDITYTSLKCENCGLWYDGWRNIWLVDCDSLSEESDCEEYQPPK